MQAEIEALVTEAVDRIAAASDLAELRALKVEYLGKKSALTQWLKTLGQHPPDTRRSLGQAVNSAKEAVAARLSEAESACQLAELAAQLAAERIDITKPGRQPQQRGGLHPITQVTQRLVGLFIRLGFRVVEGPEIEDEHHNFTALNIPKDHPARTLHDTFYLTSGELLRTHTSPVQIRVLESQAPPLRVVTPGRVYRCDSDQTHTPMFHQLEGLWVDDSCTFADLKGIVIQVLEAFFERVLVVRFRPSYFPFTEPSAEVDIQCVLCDGAGCRFCGSGWLEVLGCGMVHPNVLSGVGLDTEQYTGFAFGMGIDRLALLAYQIDDLRVLFENDVRMLQHLQA